MEEVHGAIGNYHEAKEKQKKIRCFMDGVDWQYPLDGDSKGTKMFPHELDLVAGKNHDLEECGIVEVEVKLIRWVKPQDIRGSHGRT